MNSAKTTKVLIHFGVFVLAFLSSSCATEQPTDRSRSIPSEAHAAQMRGDWAGAAQLWEQSILLEQGIWSEPELAKSPKRLAVYYYELGRSYGVIGKYSKAEVNLKIALRLDDKFNGPIGKDMVELARLNHARGENAQSATYFDKVMPKTSEVAERDPAGYFALLNEAAIVYETVGRKEEAVSLKKTADTFSTTHTNLNFPEGYSWTPYKLKSSK